MLGGLGAILIGRSLVLDGEPLPRFHVLPLAIIAVAVCLFGLTIEPLGLIVSLAVLSCCRPGPARNFARSRRSRWRSR